MITIIIIIIVHSHDLLLAWFVNQASSHHLCMALRHLVFILNIVPFSIRFFVVITCKLVNFLLRCFQAFTERPASAPTVTYGLLYLVFLLKFLPFPISFFVVTTCNLVKFLQRSFQTFSERPQCTNKNRQTITFQQLMTFPILLLLGILQHSCIKEACDVYHMIFLSYQKQLYMQLFCAQCDGLLEVGSFTIP